MLAIPVAAANATASAAVVTTRGQARVLVRELLDHTIQTTKYHSLGGAIAVSRPSPGQWTIRIGGFTAAGGNVQLTQYIVTGAGGRSFCAIADWAPDKTAMVVHVRCWGDNGKPPTQTSFAVLFNNSLVRPSTLYAAFAMPSGVFTGAATPAAALRLGTVPRVTHPSVGHYVAEFPVAPTTPFPVATAISKVPRVCNIAGWRVTRSTVNPLAKAIFITVGCFDFAGIARDTGFSFVMSNRNPLGTSTGRGGRLVVSASAPLQVTPVGNNVNTRTGVALATNSYHTVNTTPASTGTFIRLPGYPGTTAMLENQLDVVASIGNDGTRCALEDSPLRYAGALQLLLLCVRPNGTPVLHAANVGSWSVK